MKDKIGIAYEYAIAPVPRADDDDSSETVEGWSLTEKQAVEKAIKTIKEDEDHTTTYVLKVIKIVRWPDKPVEPVVEDL